MLCMYLTCLCPCVRVCVCGCAYMYSSLAIGAILEIVICLIALSEFDSGIRQFHSLDHQFNLPSNDIWDSKSNLLRELCATSISKFVSAIQKDCRRVCHGVSVCVRMSEDMSLSRSWRFAISYAHIENSDVIANFVSMLDNLRMVPYKYASSMSFSRIGRLYNQLYIR